MYDEIKKQFKDVLSYSQDISNPQVDELFDKWEKAKSYFIEQFGGKLIYEVPETQIFHLSETVKNTLIADFIEKLRVRYAEFALIDFVLQQKAGFFDNEVVKETEKDGNKIPKGMKLLKSFKYFVKDKENLMNIQNEASRVIQENKVEGKLCFSVHPLDFLSLSENACNWRSCHALDGEYRAGNLSYMIDECTFICYLRAEQKENHLPGFPNTVKWNNKKWRMLLFLSADKSMLMAGRQYPFSSTGGLEVVLKYMFKTKPEATHWCNWIAGTGKTFADGEANTYLDDNYYMIDHKLLPKKKFIIRNEGSREFNDLLYSSYYEPVYAFQYLKIIDGGIFGDETIESLDWGSWKETKFYIGGAVKCINCGINYIKDSDDTMLCDDCLLEQGDEDYYTCEYCGCRIPIDYEFYLEDGTVCCEACFNEHAEMCDGCEAYFDMMQLHVISDNGVIHRYCDKCWEDIELDGD